MQRPATSESNPPSQFCRALRTFGSELLRMVAKHTPEQLPAGVLRNRADKFDPALEVFVLGFMFGHMLRSGLEIRDRLFWAYEWAFQVIP